MLDIDVVSQYNCVYYCVVSQYMVYWCIIVSTIVCCMLYAVCCMLYVYKHDIRHLPHPTSPTL
jgi:hypothetical protein